MRAQLRPWWLLGALLMMLDGLTTWWALTFLTEAGAREGNPLGVWAIDRLGLAGMCVAKVIIGVLMVYRLACIAERGHRFDWMNRTWRGRRCTSRHAMTGARRSLYFTAVLMTLVVANNATIIVTRS